MRYPEFHFRWQWMLAATSDALWPLVANTDRFNRDTGVPAVERWTGAEPPPVNGRQRLRLRRFGVPIVWEEEPFEWVRPSRFGVTRRYRTGPVAEMRTRADLQPLPRGGTRLVYQVWARPRTALGLVAIPAQIGILSARAFDVTFRRYGQFAARGEAPRQTGQVRLAEGGAARLANLYQALTAQGARPDLAGRLIQTIEQGDDLSLTRLRPYALADAWSAPRRAVLELCLLATRLGLLELRWDVLCPLCRGAKRSSQSLAGVEERMHCDACRIDFSANFDRFVEVTFRPGAAVRSIEVAEFCVGGPQITPHIVAQQLLPAGTERTLTLPLEAGRYRLRTLALPGGQALTVAPDGSGEATVRASPSGWPGDELRLASTATLRYENSTTDEQLFILERMAWADEAATAADVIALQRFRDLFASEALRPGQRIAVGSLAVVFTDLRGSTRLYRQVGDAPAFGLVLDHFDVLREAIGAEGGAVVKTIGDAVMAVFRRPVAALRALLRAQQQLAAPREGTRPLLLKAGIHYGPCIAVTLNDRLDYFGSAVNIAARLEGLSSGSDVVVSAAVRDDPEVAEWLANADEVLGAEPLEATLKGLDEERFVLWRLTAAGVTGVPGSSATSSDRDSTSAARLLMPSGSAGADGHAVQPEEQS